MNAEAFHSSNWSGCIIGLSLFCFQTKHKKLAICEQKYSVQLSFWAFLIYFFLMKLNQIVMCFKWNSLRVFIYFIYSNYVCRKPVAALSFHRSKLVGKMVPFVLPKHGILKYEDLCYRTYTAINWKIKIALGTCFSAS